MTDTTALPAALVGDPARLFRVKIVEDSVPDPGLGWGHPKRLVSYRLTYPRVLLVELNTHRMFSRSTESSRAIPPAARRRQLEACPYRPLRWGAKVKGMGAGADLEERAALTASAGWEHALRSALYAGAMMSEAGAAKEELNRVSEPFALCRTVVSSSVWDNFFALRAHEAAHPAFQFLAKAMYVARLDSTPQVLKSGEWHLPFIGPGDPEALLKYVAETRPAGCPDHPLPGHRRRGVFSWVAHHLCRWSAARCARVSYGLLDGRPATPAADDETWAKLVGRPGEGSLAAWELPGKIGPGAWPYRPVHASPMEHQGTPGLPTSTADGECDPYSGNLPGWVQFRKLLGGECVRFFDPPSAEVAAWRDAIPPEVFGDADLY